jgi:Polyketide cyclase / dehydrase and lipid transport.
MKILRNIVIAIAAVLVLLLVIAFFLPSEFAVERSTVIAAPADSIYLRVVTPRTWARWTAWTAKADTTLAYTYAGPDSGLGAIMRFTAKQMGNGEMEIVEAVPGRVVGYVLRLTGTDMQVNGRVTLEPAEGGTKVTWRDSGDLGGNILLRYLAPMLDRNLAAAYEENFTGLRRETAAE